MYVRLRRALSICDTCPAFFVMKSSYMASHCGGIERIWPTLGRGLWAAGAAGAGMLLLLGVAECRRRQFRSRARGARQGRGDGTRGRVLVCPKVVVVVVMTAGEVGTA